MGDNYSEWMKNTLNLETEDWKKDQEPELDNEGCFHTSAPKIIYQVYTLNFEIILQTSLMPLLVKQLVW